MKNPASKAMATTPNPAISPRCGTSLRSAACPPSGARPRARAELRGTAVLAIRDARIEHRDHDIEHQVDHRREEAVDENKSADDRQIYPAHPFECPLANPLPTDESVTDGLATTQHPQQNGTAGQDARARR